MNDTLWSITSLGQCFSKPLDMMLQNLTLSLEKMSPSGVLLFCRILYRIFFKNSGNLKMLSVSSRYSSIFIDFA